MEMPPVSNVIPFPTKSEHRRFGGTGRVVSDCHQPRRLGAAAPDTEKHAHAEALELVMIEHTHR